MKKLITPGEIHALIQSKITSNCDPEKASNEILDLLKRLGLLNSDGKKIADKAGV